MSILWTSAELAKAMDADVVGPVPDAITGASIDTRTLQAGDVFFALAGENRDGHGFVKAAFEAGAAACVVEAGRAGDFAGLGTLLAVPDVLKAMEASGRAARVRVDARIVAVTGSVGKTSTKEALRHVLSAQGRSHASVASYNNHWGVPLTLTRMPQDVAYGVFEIGMSHAGEITPLSAMVRPHVAIVTIVEAVHIENFDSVDGIADAKAEIFAGLEPGGTAIINRDNPHYERLRIHAQRCAGRIVTFGEHSEADVRATLIAPDADGVDVEALVSGRRLSYRLGTPGRHNALNSLAVLAGVEALGADVDKAAADLGGIRPVDGRGARQIIRLPGGGSFTLLDESYNANPASMRAALSILGAVRPAPGGRRIAVLGDMLELGRASPELHAGLAAALNAAKVDLLFASGPMMRHLSEAVPAAMRGAYAASSADLEPIVLDAVRANDVVMIKGSNGSRMARIVTALKNRAAGAAA